MSKIILEATNIRHSYGLRRVLEIGSLTIYDGERIGLIGENGAGKSTLLDVLCGVLTPDEGFIQGANGKIHPQGNATRAEIAVLLDRILN